MIDVRSDTVTLPTPQMLDAMIRAKVGDDILGEDPTVRELEELGAHLLGKEDALFVLSGTMANQIAVMVLTRRGDEVIVGAESHIYNLEAGGLSALSQVQARPVFCPKGHHDLAAFEAAIRSPGIQSPRTGLLCLENSYDLNGGYAIPAGVTTALANLAHSRGIPVYLDGARIFNAAVALGVDAATLTCPVDAVQVCLTKGLCAPMGSLLAGSHAFIKEARWIRQRIGGGMRQAGYMAAAGIVALQTMIPQLKEDNENAASLAASIYAFAPDLVQPNQVQTNIVTIDLSERDIDGHLFHIRLQEAGVLLKPLGRSRFRMICHRGVGQEEIPRISGAISSVLSLL